MITQFRNLAKQHIYNFLIIYALILLISINCSASAPERIFITSFPEHGAEVFVAQDNEWKFMGVTPLFIHLHQERHKRSARVRVRYKETIQEKMIYEYGHVIFDFHEESKTPNRLVFTKKYSLAVAPVLVENLPDTWSSSITDYIVGQLQHHKNYTLVERNHIAQVLQDVVFTDPQSTKKLFPQVEVLLLGQVYYLGSTYILSFRLVSTENAQILVQGSAQANHCDEIFTKSLAILKKMQLI